MVDFVVYENDKADEIITLRYISSDGSSDWLVTLLLCIFLGVFGVHRFYTKQIGIGILQLITGGGCGIWVIIDVILIVTDTYRDGNGRQLVRRF
ncbi:TM2 domain-containing protein [bacterium]|nr:TM2 domain-containing protein [bacterium]